MTWRTLVQTVWWVVVLAAAAWLAWFYLGQSQTLRWDHPAHPTIYFSWRHRPPIVRQGLADTVQLPAGSTYDFSVQPPIAVACATMTVTVTGQSAVLLINHHALAANPSRKRTTTFATDPAWLSLDSAPVAITNAGSGTLQLRSLSFIIHRRPCL